MSMSVSLSSIQKIFSNVKIPDLNSKQVDKIVKIASVIIAITLGIFFSQGMLIAPIYSALAAVGSGLGILGAGTVGIAQYKKYSEASMKKAFEKEIKKFQEAQKVYLSALNSFKADLNALDLKKIQANNLKTLINQVKAKAKHDLLSFAKEVKKVTEQEIKEAQKFAENLISELDLFHLRASFEHVKSAVNSLVQKGFKLSASALIDIEKIPERTFTTMEELKKEKLHLEFLQTQLNNTKAVFDRTMKHMKTQGCIITK